MFISGQELGPSLHIAPDQSQPYTIRLNRPTLNIGSSPDQEIPLRFMGIAPRMARLVLEENEYHFHNLTSHVGDVLLNGEHVESRPLRDGDTIRLQSGTGRGVTLTYHNPFDRQSEPEKEQRRPLDSFPFLIGRDPGANLHIDALSVSWQHAQIAQRGGGHAIRDLGSTNGTFVNDTRLTDEAHRLQTEDTIRIGPRLFIYKEDHLLQSPTEQTHRMDALDLEMTYQVGVLRKRPLNVMRDVSVSIEPQEFVAIIGGSGSGKSTLLRALNGANRATGGQVLINGSSLYADYERYQPIIGYVPQTDIVQNKLSVYQSLKFGARLRFPNEPASSHEQRIDRVLEAVDLTDFHDRVVGHLSGGQRKRVSIAMELMPEPRLLFMDEPSSGLDPGLDKQMMESLRQLANRGHIVVVVTHTTLNIDLCDKVAFMARGNLVYYGPPKGALAFFDVPDYADIYNRVLASPYEDQPVPPETAAAHWAARYQQTPTYREYVLHAPPDTEPPEARRRARGGIWQQMRVLTERALAIARRDFRTIVTLLVVLPLVGLFLGWISRDPIDGGRGKMLIDRFQETSLEAFLLEDLPLRPIDPGAAQAEPPTPTPTPEAPEATPTKKALGLMDTASPAEAEGEEAPKPECPNLDELGAYTPAAEAQSLLFMLSLSVALLGIFAAAYTIVEEKSLFLRERMANLRIPPYLASKVAVYGGFTLFSCLLALAALALGVRLPAEGLILWGPLELFITLALTALAGVSIGLLISALNREVNAVTYVVLAVLFVQILFPGVIFQMDGVLEIPSRATITRWSLEALGGTANLVARDAESHFVVKNIVPHPATCQPMAEDPPYTVKAPPALSVTYPTTPEDLLVRWGALLGFSAFFLLAAGLALNRNESF